MTTISLKNNSGTITLLDNGLLEIKKPETTILLSKNCINRVQINTEGKIVIYQPNATYAVDYSLHIDRHLIPKVDAMFNTFMSAYADKDLADIYDRLNKLTERLDEIVELSPASHSTMGVLQDYKASMKMVSTQLIDMCNFNIENAERIDEKFLAVNRMINSIQASINSVDTSPIAYDELEVAEEVDVSEPVETVEPVEVSEDQNFQLDMPTIIIIIVALVFLCLYTMSQLGTSPVQYLETFTYIILEEIDDSRYVVYMDENGTLEGL
jgi:hypothetical protein